MSKYILPVVAILSIGLCVYLLVQNRQLKKDVQEFKEERATYEKLLGVTREYNNKRSDVLQQEYFIKDSIATAYKKLYEEAKAQKETISKKYNSIKNEISTTPDSGQSAITKRLLSDIQRY